MILFVSDTTIKPKEKKRERINQEKMRNPVRNWVSDLSEDICVLQWPPGGQVDCPTQIIKYILHFQSPASFHPPFTY